MSQIVVPSLKSPVDEDHAALKRWDESVRKNYAQFEVEVAGLRQGLAGLRKNPFTMWRDPAQYGARYQELQTLRLRQQLGNITSAEAAEVSSALGGPFYQVGVASDGQLPSKLFATHLPSIAVFGGLGLAFGAFAVIGKGHNLTWFLGGLIPGVLAMQYNNARQPDMLLQNAYRYILAKRTATIEFQ